MGVSVSVTGVYPNESAETAHRAKMQAVAELLTRPQTFHLWLVDLLWDFSFEVQYSHTIEASFLPTKALLHRSSANVAEAMETVLTILKRPMMAAFIGGATPEGEDYIKNNLAFMEWLERAAIRCKLSPNVVTPGGRVRPGRGKPHLPNSMPPKFVCAAIIAEVWAFFHQGTDPDASDQQAKSAAALFYGAWFPSDGWGNKPLNGWTPYMKSARRPELATLRLEVKRHLEIRSQVAKEFGNE